MSVRVSYKRQFIVGIFFLLVVLSVVEIVSRVVLDLLDPRSSYCTSTVIQSGIYYNYTNSQIAQLCHDYYSMKTYSLYTKSYSYVAHAPNQHTITFNINGDGLRGPELSAKDKNTYRIFLLGGSTMLGQLSTSDNTTIPGYLQQEFNNLKTGYKIEVINAGVGGATSFHEYELIKEKLIHYNPDLIIVDDGWNDLNYPLTESNEGKMPLVYQIQKQVAELDDYYKTPRFIDSVITFLDSRISEKLHSRDMNSSDTEITDVSEKAYLWKSRWAEICKLGKENRFDVIVTLQPVLGAGKKPLTGWEIHALDKVHYRSIAPSYPALRNALSDLDKECARTEDLSSIFDNVNKTIFYDLGHMGDAGNSIMAEKLFELSKPIVLQKLHNDYISTYNSTKT